MTSRDSHRIAWLGCGVCRRCTGARRLRHIPADKTDTDPPTVRPVHTYSIVARDPATGQLGVAVQSHWFSVGPIVPWVEAGVGAVATQSFVDPSYGPKGLALMKSGTSAPEALKQLLAKDEGRDVRQVAMIDAKGRVDAWTGPKDIQAAGHHVGQNYSVQANLMLNDKVWPAMAKAFESAKGRSRRPHARRARRGAGRRRRHPRPPVRRADRRDRHSRPDSRGPIASFDLRVDDHAEPLKELRRLVTLQRAYNHMNAGDLAVEKKDNAAALREYSAAEKLVPDKCRDGVLARGRTGQHEPRGRIAAALQAGVLSGSRTGGRSSRDCRSRDCCRTTRTVIDKIALRAENDTKGHKERTSESNMG